MDIELKRLQQVMVVARTGSFSSAAEELHITQPALSRSINTLEERYGIRIFERGRGGATLTSVGRQVVEEAATLLQGARAVDHNLRLFSSGEAGHIALGMGPLIASLVLPELGLRCLRERPQLEVRVVTRPAAELYLELVEGNIEMLFCSAHQLADKTDIEEAVVGEIEIAALVRAGHPLASLAEVSKDDVSLYPLLTGAEVHSAGPRRNRGGLICDNYEILRRMVVEADAVWLSSPQLVAADLAGGALVALNRVGDSVPDRVSVYMVTRRGERLSPAADALHGYIREHFRALAG